MCVCGREGGGVLCNHAGRANGNRLCTGWKPLRTIHWLWNVMIPLHPQTPREFSLTQPFFHIKHLPHPSSFYIVHRIFLNCVLCHKLCKGMDDLEKLWAYISIHFTKAHNWMIHRLSHWKGVHLNMNVSVKLRCMWLCIWFLCLQEVFVHMCMCVRLAGWWVFGRVVVPCWDQPCPSSLVEGTSCGMYTHSHTYTHIEQLLLLQLLLSPNPGLPVPKEGERGWRCMCGGSWGWKEKERAGGAGVKEKWEEQ